MANPSTRVPGRPEENGRYLPANDQQLQRRRDGRDRSATERVDYATGPEQFEDEPGGRDRWTGPETPDLDTPHRRQPPSGPGVSHVGAAANRASTGSSAGPRASTTSMGSQWYREPLTVAELMTREVKTVTPETLLADVAALMRDEDVGVIPIVDANGHLQGVVTDRDIVVRGLAKGAKGAKGALTSPYEFRQ